MDNEALKRKQDFNHVFDLWITALAHYDFPQLCAKPAVNSWSLGQVYMHLITDTNYFLEQIKICIATNDNEGEQASPDAKILFLNNEFPDVKIEGAPGNLDIPQPRNKEQLMDGLLNLKNEMNKVALQINTTPFKGKTKHPGLNYFNAADWLLFAEMHIRHHFRQKKRIDEFLMGNSV